MLESFGHELKEYDGSSYTWKSIIKATTLLEPSFHFHVGEGNLSFWFDRWCDQGPLCSMVDYVHIQDTTMSLKDMCVDGVWDLHMLATPLTPNVTSIICDTYLHNATKEYVISSESPTREYNTTNSTYKWLTREHSVNHLASVTKYPSSKDSKVRVSISTGTLFCTCVG